MRIKSLKELEPGFKPRWFRIIWIMVVATLVLVFTQVLAQSMGFDLVGQILTIFILIAVCTLLVAFIAIKLLFSALLFAGLFWPRAGVWGARWEAWLEKDLDWGGPK